MKKLRAQTVSHVTQRHRVVNVQRKRLVEAQARREQRVVAVDARRTPVVCKRCVQALRRFWVDAPKGLTRHPVQEVVSYARCRAYGCRKFSRIVGGAELIEAGISLSALDIVKRSHGRRLLARSKPNLRHANRISTELWNETGGVTRKRRRIPCQNHRFHIEVVDRYEADFHRRRRGRIEGL